MKDKWEGASERAKELVVYCHEEGLTVCVGIAEGETGLSLRAMDGAFPDEIILLATLLIQMEKQTGEKASKVLKEISKIIKEYGGKI